MLNNKRVWLVSLLSLNVLAGSTAIAMDGPPTFDLEGDGKRTPVKFPFPYFPAEPNDDFTVTYQGGYTVDNIENNPRGVKVIGTLMPCIGIAATDGKTLVTAHKHSSNSLKSLANILKENLNLTEPKNLYARIYTTQDDVAWLQNSRTEMHGGKTHREAVVEIRDCLEQLGIPRSNIPYSLQNLRDTKTNELVHGYGALGRYEIAELCVAVRLNKLFVEKNRKTQIQFFSIDPFTEDVFGYKGTHITQAEHAGVNLPLYQALYPNVDFTKRWVAYDDIPAQYFEDTGNKDGYKQQRGICQRRLEKEEREHYIKHFGKPQEELMRFNSFIESYNTLEFYPIHRN